MEISKTCMDCHQIYTIEVSLKAHTAWKSGMYVQDAFPELSEDDRELLISGLCGKCFDDLFEEEV